MRTLYDIADGCALASAALTGYMICANEVLLAVGLGILTVWLHTRNHT
jgi:hypothetical protein